ncbi:hypothetical protein HYR69_01240, partial [Candidatus Sumerlaeota bacterium]|nr:hypothetical protein [Candidatus Sumerlaeota bacterium]
MFNRSRSLSMLMLLLCGSMLMLGPVGCASHKPRERWWQFWRPKKMNVADGLHSSDRVILPPPPEAIAGANGPNGSALSPEELARLNNGELPEVEPLRKAPAGSVDGLVTVHFAFDSYELDEGAKQTLEQNLQWMSTHPGVQ